MKIVPPIDLEKVAHSLCNILWSQAINHHLEGHSLLTLDIIHNSLPGIVCNTKFRLEDYEALAYVGATAPINGRRLDFRTLAHVDMEVVWKYLLEQVPTLPPHDPELFTKPTKDEKRLMIKELGAVYSRVASPDMEDTIYNLFHGNVLVIYGDYETLVVDVSSKGDEASLADRLEAYMSSSQIDYTDLYSLFPYEVRTDSEGDRYAHGVMLRCSQGGHEVLESVGLLLTSTIREDLRLAIGQGFIVLSSMYGNVQRRRKYSSVLLLEQLIKAPEVYVTNMHDTISKICTFLLEDPDVGPEVVARIKKRIRL